MVKLVLRMLVVAASLYFLGCSQQPILYQGNFYILAKGNSLQHGSSYVSLYFKDKEELKEIWDAISFRFASAQSFDNSIIFGAALDDLDYSKGRVHIMYFSPKTGVVEITPEIMKAASRLPAELPNVVKCRLTGEQVEFTFVEEGQKIVVSPSALQKHAEFVAKTGSAKTLRNNKYVVQSPEASY